MAERSFITGATGQIGVPLVAALVAAGHEVTAWVRDEARASAVRAAGGTCLVGHLGDAEALERGVAAADHVWHLAGGLRGPGVNPDSLNRLGTVPLAAAAHRHRSRLASFTFASTCAVYGDRSGLWVGEDYATAPATAYGTSKVAAEEVLLASGLPLRIARIAAVYGPGLRFTQTDAIRAGRCWLPGEGRNHVPVVHIDDCVAALIAIGCDPKGGGIYHVSGPTTPSLKDFYTAVAESTGGQPARFWSTWIPSVFQYGAARQNEAIMMRLGRKPRFTTDNLRLFTASVRLRVDRLERELGFEWRYADYRAGVGASVRPLDAGGVGGL